MGRGERDVDGFAGLRVCGSKLAQKGGKKNFSRVPFPVPHQPAGVPQQPADVVTPTHFHTHFHISHRG